jgi:hypothetical protein
MYRETKSTNSGEIYELTVLWAWEKFVYQAAS